VGKHWPPRGPDDLDEERRARMRRDVLSHLRPRAPTFGDHAYAALSLLAAPAPYIVRAALSLVVVAALVATATVASADSLPDEPLYGVKVASEQLRLAIARTPEDRAAVWLSMAEHRLTEAERLALAGREPEALVAASAYGTQLAEAAAELAAIERLEAKGPSVVARLKERLAGQQARATDIAERLRTGAANARSAPAFDTVASAPPADPSGTLSELIAEHAAAVTDQVAAVAAQRAADEAVPVPPTAAAVPAAAPAAPAPAVAPPAQRATQPQRQQTPVRQAETQASAPPLGIGSVTAPDVTATPAAPAGPDATPSTASTATEERAAQTKRPGIGQELSEIQKRFKDALEQIREKQKEAREAVKKAQERGKKTPDPARSRSVEADDDAEDAD
jgi:hypothetical protein